MARVDARAPQLAVVLEEALGPRAEWTIPIQSPAVQWDVAQHADARLALACWLILRNEGRATAFVETPADVVVLNLQSAPAESLRGYVGDRRPKGSRFALEPGGVRRLYVEVGMTLSEWVAVAGIARPKSLHVIINADDTFSDGVRDSVIVRLTGTPIEKTRAQQVWQSVVDVADVDVLRTVREYQRLGRARRRGVRR